MAAKLANRKTAQEQKFVHVKIREWFWKEKLGKNGQRRMGLRTRWEKRLKESGLDAALGR